MNFTNDEKWCNIKNIINVSNSNQSEIIFCVWDLTYINSDNSVSMKVSILLHLLIEVSQFMPLNT